MTTPVTIDKLFDTTRLPSGSSVLPVVLYFPVGLALALVRLFIGFHVYIVTCVLPKTSFMRCVVLRVMCGVLGLIVVEDGVNNRRPTSRVFVANYTTPFDHVAVELVKPIVMPSIWDLPRFMMWLLGYRDMGAKNGRETLIQNAKCHCQQSDIPLLAFPEGASTNGRVGLLKFSVWPFSLDQAIQPIAIRIHRPVISVAPSVLNGKWWTDLFWILFVPFSIFQIRYLPPLSQGEDETSQEFARRVQLSIAKSLEVEPTAFTSADKLEYIKRYVFSQVAPPSSSTSGSVGGGPMDLMVNQVKVVLPHVPVDAIRSDLALTKDIDLTITNILEGRVTFDPEEPGVEADRASSPVAGPVRVIDKPTSSVPEKPSAASALVAFPKSPQQRQQSFEERKKELLENARQRYIQKHGLAVESAS